nr:ribonuclease H-like domain-containing protein [Tanacetum cinerariifolium]
MAKGPLEQNGSTKKKKDEKGIMVRNKARLVTQGHTQEEGIDFNKVFALVVRIEAIRLFLAYASFKDFLVYQMDMKSAFLYGKIKEEVYVYQPPGFEDLDFPDKVYKVEKALYGLHQASKAWKEFCIEFEKMTHKKFQMSSMGELTFFLGLSKLLIFICPLLDYDKKGKKMLTEETNKKNFYKEEIDLETVQATTTAKLPILKQAQTTTNADGTSTTLIPSPVTTEEKAQKKNDVKARIGSSKRVSKAKLDYEGFKRQKTNEASGSVQEQPDEEENELSQEDLQQMMMVVPVEEVYVEALQVKYLIIDWEVYTEESKNTKRFSRYMHDPLTWRLYDTYGVHHVSTEKGMDNFMLVEKEYLLSKGVLTLIGSNVTFLILYVDDIIIMGNHIPSLQSVKDYLGKCFAMKDLREAAFILGIKIYRDSSKRLIGLVDWKSSNQSTTAMLATEAEYITASKAVMEAVWIRKFISGLGIVPTINEPIRMFCDNSATLHFANEPGVQRGAKHYHRRYHYVRESIVLGEIIFLKVHTDDNLADPFTKALSKGKLTQHARSMRLHLASSFM